ncbi:CopG family ribbon-helix-helix protein [Ochrobactrum quorumnocens]|uniref:CopG family ribbon-helix-helix protein n=1 Tax=Ochrobactrum quorumnocens TaxID=271865 RepID=UPI000BA8A933
MTGSPPMSQTVTGSVTLRVPEVVLSGIDIIADATERSRSYIILRALRTYLLNEGRYFVFNQRAESYCCWRIRGY